MLPAAFCAVSAGSCKAKHGPSIGSSAWQISTRTFKPSCCDSSRICVAISSAGGRTTGQGRQSLLQARSGGSCGSWSSARSSACHTSLAPRNSRPNTPGVPLVSPARSKSCSSWRRRARIPSNCRSVSGDWNRTPSLCWEKDNWVVMACKAASEVSNLKNSASKGKPTASQWSLSSTDLLVRVTNKTSEDLTSGWCNAARRRTTASAWTPCRSSATLGRPPSAISVQIPARSKTPVTFGQDDKAETSGKGTACCSASHSSEALHQRPGSNVSAQKE